MKLLLLMAEIRLSPVEVGSLSHYLQGLYIPGDWPDFFHQQYHLNLLLLALCSGSKSYVLDLFLSWPRMPVTTRFRTKIQHGIFVKRLFAPVTRLGVDPTYMSLIR